MSRVEAEEQLLDDLEPIEVLVSEEVHAPLTQGQYDALCSLAFNIGVDAFRQSDILQALNNGRVLDAANGFDLWRKATINGQTYVVDALMRRRTAEKSLFLRNEPAVPAPSAMLVPQQETTGTRDDRSPEWTGPNVATDLISDRPEADPSPADKGRIEAANLGPYDPVAPDFEPHDANSVDADEDLDIGEMDAQTLTTGEDDLELSDDEMLDALEDIDLDAMLELSADDIIEGEDAASDRSNDDADETSDLIVADLSDVEDEDEAGTTLVEPTSSIAHAADSLGDRLSALLDSDDSDTGVEDDSGAFSADTTEALEASDPPRSNLVSFPTRERVMPDTVEEDQSEADKSDTSDESDPSEVQTSAAPEEDLVLIDNLEADDVIRASRDPDNQVFDPDGDPVENAMRYLERKAANKPETKKGGGFWIPVAIGALLVGASAVLLARGATELLASWGPTAVVAAAITGGLTLVFALYAFARGRFA
jgi:hypothetical protein